jgi:hypothetical protein
LKASGGIFGLNVSSTAQSFKHLEQCGRIVTADRFVCPTLMSADAWREAYNLNIGISAFDVFCEIAASFKSVINDHSVHFWETNEHFSPFLN